jgi:DNA ligase (NAD+)
VQRAGDVIPEVVGPVISRREGRSLREFEMPKTCPVCDTPVQKDPAQAATYCPNRSCPSRMARLLEHFAGRGGLDIEGLGEQLAARLVRLGLVRSLADLYDLPQHREELLALDGIGPKTLDNLFARIEESKTRPLRRLLVALGIRHIGGETATALAVHFGAMEALRAASLEDISHIDGIGPIVAQSIYDYMHDPEYSELLDRLQAAGLRMDEERAGRDGILNGETFVVTGSLDRWSRDRAEALIKELGGKVGGSVTKKTTYLVAGEGGGSKRTKAEALGTPVLDEEEFVALLRERGWSGA